jgi:hypothetical protein
VKDHMDEDQRKDLAKAKKEYKDEVQITW